MSNNSQIDKLIQISLENQKILNDIHQCMLLLASENRSPPSHSKITRLHTSLRKLKVINAPAMASSIEDQVRATLTLAGRCILSIEFFGKSIGFQYDSSDPNGSQYQEVASFMKKQTFADFLQVLIDEHGYPKKQSAAADRLDTLLHKKYRGRMSDLSKSIKNYLNRGKGWIKNYPLNEENTFDDSLDQLLNALGLDQQYFSKYANLENIEAIKAEFLNLNEGEARLAYQQRRKIADSYHTE